MKYSLSLLLCTFSIFGTDEYDVYVSRFVYPFQCCCKDLLMKKKFQAFRPFNTIQIHLTIVLTSRKICPKNHFNFDSIQRFKTFKVLATFFFICSTSSQQQYFTIVYSYLTFLICKSACPKGG